MIHSPAQHIGVLGGTRFIGYHLVQALLAAGHTVTLFNRGRTQPPRALPETVRRVIGDRASAADVGRFVAHDFDAVFDFSSLTAAHVEAIVDHPQLGRLGHYVFCSTSSVYARPLPVPCSESSATILELATYGGAKRRAELQLLEASRSRNLRVTILRPTGVFGPFDPAQALPVLARLHHDLPVPVLRAFRSRSSFLFVEDLVSVCLALINRGPQASIYNVAGPEAVTATEFIEHCATAAGLVARTREIQHWPYSRLQLPLMWPSDELVIDASAVRRDLGVEFTSLERGLVATWSWLSSDESRLHVDLSRGERYIREDGRLPWWIKPWLSLRNQLRP